MYERGLLEGLSWKPYLDMGIVKFARRNFNQYLISL
jgi:hypothetical protein